MRSRILLLLLVFVALSCQEDEKITASCDLENPVEDLDWLRQEIDQHRTQTTYSDTFVYKATYNGRTVFYIVICCPVCDVAPPEIRTCSGESLGRLGSEIDSEDLKNPTIIWRTENGVCS